jgi:tyrosine-protein kinase Etk/Wzc
LPGEGKTLTAVNFALLGASRSLKVLLIDADLRCGVIGKTLGIKSTRGFAEVLAHSVVESDVIRSVSIEEVGTLSVIVSGALPKMPGAVFTRERVQEVLAELSPNYDLIVIDSPPVNLLADAGILGSAADATLLVVRAGYTQADDLHYAIDQLAGMRATVIGTLLNDIDLRRNAKDDGSYRYLEAAARYTP